MISYDQNLNADHHSVNEPALGLNINLIVIPVGVMSDGS